MKLYEITHDLSTVIDGGMVFDEETGEVLFDSDNLESLEAEYRDKLEACALYVKDLNAEASALRAEEKALAERRRIKEKKAERMREYILSSMESTGTSRLETPKAALSTRKSQRVGITDEKSIPREYVETVEKVDKSAIRDALKKGIDVKGAFLEERVNLVVK